MLPRLRKDRHKSRVHPRYIHRGENHKAKKRKKKQKPSTPESSLSPVKKSRLHEAAIMQVGPPTWTRRLSSCKNIAV